LALAAGVDLVLLGNVADQFELGQLFADREDSTSAARIWAARERAPKILPPLDVVGCREHQAIAQEIAERSITVVRNTGQLPLRLTPDDRVAVITPQLTNLTPADTSAWIKMTLAEFVQQRHPNTKAYELPTIASTGDITAIVEAAETADIVIVGTISVSENSTQVALVRELYKRGKKPIVLALRTPYDLNAFPMIETYLCSYGIRPASMQAVVRVLFGEIEAQGCLPCEVSAAALT